MSDLFLTPEELETLTGYMRPSAQRRWLADQGITHRVNAIGNPVVLRSALETTTKERGKRTTPDLAALRVLNGQKKTA